MPKKWFHLKNERFWHLYKNGLKHGQFGQNSCRHRLWKVAQRAINRPIWSHWKRAGSVTVRGENYLRLNLLISYSFFTRTRFLCRLPNPSNDPSINRSFPVFDQFLQHSTSKAIHRRKERMNEERNPILRTTTKKKLCFVLWRVNQKWKNAFK